MISCPDFFGLQFLIIPRRHASQFSFLRSVSDKAMSASAHLCLAAFPVSSSLGKKFPAHENKSKQIQTIILLIAMRTPSFYICDSILCNPSWSNYKSSFVFPKQQNELKAQITNIIIFFLDFIFGRSFVWNARDVI